MSEQILKKIDKKMEILSETNEWFDCIAFPEKKADPQNKQEITLKWNRDEYLEMVEKWRKELSTNTKKMELEGIEWK